MDPDSAIFLIDLQEAKNVFLLISVHLHDFSKIKSQREVAKQ
jgi:hypothetical protein